MMKSVDQFVLVAVVVVVVVVVFRLGFEGRISFHQILTI
jgi:hypothetical protein